MDTVEVARADALELWLAEEAAVTIRCHSGPNLPELLMTPAIARLMWELRAQYQPAIATVGAELLPRRQARLGRASPTRLFFVTGEESITRVEAGCPDPGVAAEQLTRLRDHAGERQVSVRIRPLTAPLTPEPLDRFTITTDARGRHTVFVEAREPSGLLILRDPEHTGLYLRIFARLCGDSLDETDSRGWIADALQRRTRRLPSRTESGPARRTSLPAPDTAPQRGDVPCGAGSYMIGE